MDWFLQLDIDELKELQNDLQKLIDLDEGSLDDELREEMIINSEVFSDLSAEIRCLIEEKE